MSRPTTDAFPDIPGFRIEQEIGRGTSARVFRAVQEKLNRPVALKVIATPGDEGNRRALRLFREASLTGALDHPGIVRAIDAGDQGELCWFAMELVEGRTLQQVLDEGGPWPWKRAVALGLDVLDALDHAHRRGVVHRDLKPSNILIDSGGHARILDLGLARRETDPRLTHEGGTVGTPRYMAPEQALDPGKVDGRADLFALGAVLYRAISGIAPFDGETVAAVLTRLLYDEPAPLATLQPDLPAALSLVIGKALAKSPAHRFQDARAFAAALREAARGRRPDSVAVPIRRRRLLALSGVGAVLVAAALFLLVRAKPAPPEIPPAATRPVAQAPPPRVRDFVPPARAGIAPLDRARLALEAADGESSPDLSKDLDAALAPLRSDLTVAAAQHAAGVRGVLLTGGVEPARQKMGQLAERLRADLRTDGDEPLHPGLERLVEDVSRAASETFERELKAEQEDAARDLLAALAELPSRPGAARWSGPEQLDAVQQVLKDRGLLSLDGEQRARIIKARDEALRSLAELPVKAAARSLTLAREKIRDGQYRSARDLLAGLVGAAGDEGMPGAAVEVRPLLDAIEAGETKVVAEAEALIERLSRGGAASLDAGARRRRLSDLDAGLEGLSRLRDEVPQIREPLALAAKVAVVARDAALLRDRVLERLGAGTTPAVAVDWKLRGREGIGPRVVTGREGGRILARRPDGAPERFEAEEVAAETVAEVDRAFGGAPSQLAIALLEFWDGEDDTAYARLKTLAGDPVRDRLLGVVGAAIETAAASFPTEAEREAFPVFLQARRRLGEGSYARALELVEPMLSDRRLAGSAFLRRHQEEIGLIAERSRNMLVRSSRLRPFGTVAGIKDESTGIVRLLWAFHSGSTIEGLALPPGAELVPQGLRWPGRTGDRAGLPERAPALRIAFPEGVRSSPAWIEVELLRSVDPVPFAGLSFGGYSLLVVGDLRHGNAFAGVPLHGLERELVRIESVQRAVCVHGSVGDARKALAAWGRPAAINRGDATVLRMRIDCERGELLGLVGDERIPASGERRDPVEPPALDLRLPPGVVIRSLTVELPLVPRKPG